jgi:Fe-S cluster biogenesis protein NfuA
MSETVEKKIQTSLEKIRPQLQMDGGDVEFISFQNGTVKVKLLGHCAGCPMHQVTLKQGIENFLKQEVPEVKKVESVQ